MTDPLICCICLDPGGRPDFIRRAESCWHKQTIDRPGWFSILKTDGDLKSKTIGALRNMAIHRHADCEIVAHWDWDDWSSPQRLQYQLDFMRSTGVAVVGFNTMAFYDAVRDRVLYYDSRMANYGLGTSLFYKREAWERVKFPDITPEDTTWQHQIGHDNIRGCSSIVDGKPMMIQVLHGGNAAANASGAIFEKASEALEKQVREILKNA